MSDAIAEAWRLCATEGADPLDLAEYVPELLAAVDRLRADLGHVEPAEEPACEAMAGGDVRCECCGLTIMAGEPVDIFDDGGRWVNVHPGPCPEPEMWTVQHEGDQSPDDFIPRPFEAAYVLARNIRRWCRLPSIRLVRVRKGPARG
jgi:hypothetical protein